MSETCVYCEGEIRGAVLTDGVDHAHGDLAECRAVLLRECARLGDALARGERELGEAVERLEPYTRHDDQCGSRGSFGEPIDADCTCGLAAALKGK